MSRAETGKTTQSAMATKKTEVDRREAMRFPGGEAANNAMLTRDRGGYVQSADRYSGNSNFLISSLYRGSERVELNPGMRRQRSSSVSSSENALSRYSNALSRSPATAKAKAAFEGHRN